MDKKPIQNSHQSAGDSKDSIGSEEQWPLSQTGALPWGKKLRMPKAIEWLTPKEGWGLLQDLRVHQIELEMQNAELRRAYAELEASRARYFDLYDMAPVGYCTIGEKSQIIEGNITAATLLGVAREELANQPLTRFILPEDQDIFYRQRKKLLANKLAQVSELRVVRPDGTRFWVQFEVAVVYDTAGSPRFRVVISDIADRKRAEDEKRKLQDQMIQTRKMEAVVRLAGGIAHDFNNILQGIYGSAQLLIMDKTEKDPEYKYAMQIMKSGERGAELVRQLLFYSHKMDGKHSSILVNQQVRKTIAMLQKNLPGSIRIELILESRLWSIVADPVQIEQIIVNIAGNALEAMPEGGQLMISTENITLDHHGMDTHLEAKPGRHVLMTVSDTGCGMEAKTMETIFDPFFTTKMFGRGLGLAVVYGIVKSLGGHIGCESVAGQGTTFKIYLPANDD